MKKLIFYVSFLMLFTGCASTVEYVRNPALNEDNAATVIIYRPNTSYHKFNPEKPFVYIDDKLLGKLGVNSSLRVHLPKGSYKISIKQPFMFMPANESNKLELQVNEHKYYYVRYANDFSGFEGPAGAPIAVGETDLRIVDEENGKIRR